MILSRRVHTDWGNIYVSSMIYSRNLMPVCDVMLKHVLSIVDFLITILMDSHCENIMEMCASYPLCILVCVYCMNALPK